jgi:hypothetical protein
MNWRFKNHDTAKCFFRLIVGLSILSLGFLAVAADTQPADAKKAQPTPLKPKPDFEPLKLSIVPQKAEKDEANLRFVKPGHWMAATAEAKTNNFDFIGTLDAEVKPATSGKPFELDRTTFDLAISRPAILPKGQAKFLEFLFYVPRQADRAWLATELRTSGGSLAATPGPEPLSLMKPYQYFLVVLAADTDRYRLLEALDSVRAPHEGESLQYYRVMAPPLKKPLALPSNPLAWTTIAYMLWDDVDPELLTAEQQQALVDWLHFGGQLIISGPKSLDQLAAANLLYPLLPATAGEPMEITDEKLRPLNDAWTLPVKTKPGRPLAASSPWSGIGLQLTKGAEFIPGTAELVAEHRVGRGRVVVTGFRLSQRELWNWPGFDGLFNACLRRPPRQFSASEFGTLTVNWADSAKQATDPTWISQLRFSSRDLIGADSRFKTDEPDSLFSTANRPPIEIPAALASAWDDFSDVSNAARQSLIEAAGIVIPESRFVVVSTLAYLFVLVPLNWLIFRAIGRVELAWVAAPVIAVGAMAVVVKVAQLDIGFARSQTEIRVLETFDNYGRAHLTRYTALYTSLSTTYDVHSDNPTTLVLPFPAAHDFTPLAGQTPTTVTYSSVPSVSLRDFTVASNSTGMLHSEQMIHLGGSFQYVEDTLGPALKCTTQYSIQSGIIVRQSAGGTTEVSELRGFSPSQPVDFDPIDDVGLKKICERVFGNVPDVGENIRFNLTPLAELFARGHTLRPGEMRLIGISKAGIAGLDVDPAASQLPRGVTLVVVRLAEPPLVEPVPDKNTRGDVLTTRSEFPEGEALP